MTSVRNQTWMIVRSTYSSPQTVGNSCEIYYLKVLFFVADLSLRGRFRSTITSLLESGTTVLADRYAFSGIAFSASKGLPYEWCRGPDINLPAPDLTLFLDLAPEKARERGGYGEERYEKEEMQKRVRGVFEVIGTEMRTDNSSYRWVTVDAGEEKEAVQSAMWKHVEPLQNGIEGPIKRLWESHLKPQ